MATPPPGCCSMCWSSFEQTEEFRDLAPRTQADYREIIDKKIEPEFGDLPLAALTEEAYAAANSKTGAIASLLSRAGKLTMHGWCSPAFSPWRSIAVGLMPIHASGEGACIAAAAETKSGPSKTSSPSSRGRRHHLHLPLTLALWTGQRQGDLLRLTWSAYDGTHIRLRQSKTGARVSIPVGGPLKAVLDATPKRSPVILLSTEKKPWTEDGFRSSLAEGLQEGRHRRRDLQRSSRYGGDKAGDRRLHRGGDRDITGHILRDVRSILDAHYLHRDPALCRGRDQEARSGNKVSQTSSQLF